MGCINRKNLIKSDIQILTVRKTNEKINNINNINIINDNVENNSTNIKKSVFSEKTINSFIINYPKLICQIKNIENNYEKEVTITPNSVNGKMIKNLDGKIYLNEDSNFNESFVKDFKTYLKNFYIYFNKKKNRFIIHDKSKIYGLYKKINQKIKLENSLIISFSNYHIYIKKIQNNNIKINCIQETNKIIYTNTFNNNEINEITIGRNNDCIINLDDDNISRIQMTILFENNNWFIYDGCKEKESLNGIWLNAIDNNINIENKDILKIGKLIFKILSIDDN
jgi:hypothetical protein